MEQRDVKRMPRVEETVMDAQRPTENGMDTAGRKKLNVFRVDRVI